jgi:glyoxylase-like metal-dependent hydrolase (beta-lactamase superfamily II)/rhodanese-related sulfurtransferase
MRVAMILHQIRSTDGTGSLAYLLIDEMTSAAVMVDPNLEDLETIQKMVSDEYIRLTHVIDTHTHADHVSAAGELRKRFGAQTVMHENTKHKWKVVNQGDKFGIGDTLRANANVPIDRYVNDGDIVESGSLKVKAVFTPGHTDNHIALMAGDCLFTGDLLLIGQAGRSDLPGGNPEEQYDSLFGKIMPLPDSTKMYPGHDYEENTFSYLGEEKKSNPFLAKRSKPEYVDFVRDFFPPIAEAIASGGKMTLQCGVKRVARATDSFRNVSPMELSRMLQRDENILLVDVREPGELIRMGHIDRVVNIPVGEIALRLAELPSDKARPIVCVCASGGRSFEAAHYLSTQGYTNVMNLDGGTIGWIKEGFSVVQPVGSR